MTALCSLHYGFLVRPWHRNVAKALRKEPKWFLVEVKNADTRLSPALADLGKERPTAEDARRTALHQQQ